MRHFRFVNICAFIMLLTVSGNLKTYAQYVDTGRYVRVTTGVVQCQGWESTLIRGNPNLAHFTWCPVASYTQGTQRVYVPQGPNRNAMLPPRQARPAYNHVPANYMVHRQYNPLAHGAIHVPTVVPPKQLNLADEARVHGAICLPPPRNDLFRKLASQQAQETVSARLRQQSIAAYPEVAGTIYSKYRYDSGSTSSVHGRLVTAYHYVK